jgi:hypothetical protein
LTREVTTTQGPKIAFDPDTLLRINPNNAKNELKDTFVGRTVDGIRGQVPNVAVISKARQVILKGMIKTASSNSKSSATTTTRDYRVAAVTKQKQVQRLQLEKEVKPLKQPTPLLPPVLPEPMPEPELVWVAVDDQRTCQRCSALNGETFGAMMMLATNGTISTTAN